METDLSIRLHLYATAAERLARDGIPVCADALANWRSATASHSAGIICSHTRILRGDSEPDPAQAGQDEPDILIAGKRDKPADIATDRSDRNTDTQRHHLPLPPGKNSSEILALGAEGVIVLKGRNG
jgi:hypothetical protein